eukprot:scaffold147258_cov16-Prasinocladus_malaysianus.AAC.1
MYLRSPPVVYEDLEMYSTSASLVLMVPQCLSTSSILGLVFVLGCDTDCGGAETLHHRLNKGPMLIFGARVWRCARASSPLAPCQLIILVICLTVREAAPASMEEMPRPVALGSLRRACLGRLWTAPSAILWSLWTDPSI